MATFTAYKAFDFTNIQEVHDNSINPGETDTQYVLSDGVASSTTTGSGFIYTDSNQIQSGTMTAFDITTNGSHYYSLSELDVDLDPARAVYTTGYLVGGTTYYGAQADLARALSGDDEVNGSLTADNLAGFSGNDTIYGNAGNDTLLGGPGNDSLDGGAGTDTAVFSGSASSYTISVQADGTVLVKGPDGTDTLNNIENITFGSTTTSLMHVLPTAQIQGATFYAKVQSYFISMAGRSASADELSTFASLLSSKSGNVWVDSNGVTGNSDSLVGYLNTELTTLTTGKTNSQIVDEMYARLTGQDAPSSTIHDYYVTKLDAGGIRVKGLANAMLNDLAIMPKIDNHLGQPGTWSVNMFDSLTPADYQGYLTQLKLVGVTVSNLDSSGNLT